LDNVDSVHEGEPIGILVGLQRGFMHEASFLRARDRWSSGPPEHVAPLLTLENSSPSDARRSAAPAVEGFELLTVTATQLQ